MALNFSMPDFRVPVPDILGAEKEALTISALRGDIAMHGGGNTLIRYR